MTHGSLRLLPLLVAWWMFSDDLGAAPPAEYAPADPGLRLELIDSSPDESFLSMRCDGLGRLFVGGREAVFRYDLRDDGKNAAPRRIELYRFPAHSWVYDIELRGPDLYVLTMNALYVIPDGAIRTTGLKPRKLLWGVPAGHVHQCFHGLAWGPEGDLYLSMGDPLWYYGDFDRADHWGHWTFFTPGGTSPGEWQRHPYNGVGAVFRIRPDGTQFQTVATGLRNSCGLAFDSDFNLFTNDNDHEGLPHAYVPGRLNHVTPHAYFAWPRGWMPHLTPERADLLDTMTTGLGRAVPVGQAWYDDPLLGAQYRNNLLVARWCTRAVTRYPVQPAGASYHCTELPLIAGRDLARPVGVTVGRGGRIFVTVSYMANNEGSPVYRGDVAMLTTKDDTPEFRYKPIDLPAATTADLFRELSSDAWSRRQICFVELTRRGPEACQAAVELLKSNTVKPQVARYLYWIAAAAARESGTVSPAAQAARELLLARARDSKDRTLQFHAIRALTEFYGNDPSLAAVLSAVLSGASATPAKADSQQVDVTGTARITGDHVRHAALLGFFKLPGALPMEAIGPLARGDDRYLRQAAVRLMADRLSPDELVRLAESDDARARLAAVLAIGFRITLPAVEQVLDDYLPLSPWTNPQEAYVITYADGQVDLRTFGRVGTYTVAEHWKAGTRTPDQERLFAALAQRLDDADTAVRMQAAQTLLLLNDSRTEPKVQLVRRQNEQRKLQLASMTYPDKAWVAGPFADQGRGFDTAHGPEQGPIELAARYTEPGRPAVVWKQMPRGPRFFNFKEAFGNVDDSSTYAFFRLECSRKQQAMLLVGSDDGIKVWLNGRPVWTNDISRAALPLQDIVYLDLEPGSNDVLFRVRNVSGESGLYIHYRSLDKIPPTLPEPVTAGSLAERLKQATASVNAPLDPRFLEVDWAEAARQGNAGQGRKLFGAEGLGCAKCHSIRADQPVTGGPSLTETARRFTIPHLVESILVPSRVISPVFRATLVVTKDGKQQMGLVIGETGEKLELLLPDAKRLTLAKADIEESRLQDVSPMPAGLIKTPDELRDLLAYLLNPGEQ